MGAGARAGAGGGAAGSARRAGVLPYTLAGEIGERTDAVPDLARRLAALAETAEAAEAVKQAWVSSTWEAPEACLRCLPRGRFPPVATACATQRARRQYSAHPTGARR